MKTSFPVRGILRNGCITLTLLGLCLLGVTVFDAWEGRLAERFFPDVSHTGAHHFSGLFLALPVPLHIIFIGLIIQKRWLTAPMARFAWLGITLSGLWLGVSLGVRTFVL